MVFNSFTFAIFFTAVLAVHYSPIAWRAKKASLLFASYLFYAAWNPPFVALIWLSTVVDWHLAKRIHESDDQRRRRLFLALSLATNLGLLGYFKYAGFVLDNFTAALATVGVQYQAAPLDIVLPIGISFYTFQTLSYTLDIYKRRSQPWHSFLDYALFVTFFPQLVAGPIVRAVEFLPQCINEARAHAREFGWGLALMLLGVFQKTVIADTFLAPVVERVFDASGPVSQADAIVGTLAFAGQIFSDFAGYSTTAIGAAMCLGFALPRNFRFPYAAIGFADFWRRWHISLSSWLRDYLYIGLGGNRGSTIRTYVNLMLTMLIGGLWHGASWTFVVWGGLHGSYLVMERLAHRTLGHMALWSLMPVRVLLGLGTFSAVCLAWIFFRADSFARAWGLVRAAAGAPAENALYLVSAFDQMLVLTTMAAIVGFHWLLRDKTLEEAAASLSQGTRVAMLTIMMMAITLSPGEDRAFIYFQF